MGRTKGAKNKEIVALPDVCNLPPEERIALLANLMIDRILDDQKAGQQLYRMIKKQGHATVLSN